MENSVLYLIVGGQGSGKSDLAVRLANHVIELEDRIVNEQEIANIATELFKHVSIIAVVFGNHTKTTDVIRIQDNLRKDFEVIVVNM